MKTSKKIAVLLALTSFLVVLKPSFVFASTPELTIQKLFDLTKSKQPESKVVDSAFKSHVDLDRFLSLALRDHWTSWTPIRKNEFKSKFSPLLISRINRLFQSRHNHKIDSAKIKTIRIEKGFAQALFEAKINDADIKIHYDMINRNGTWKIFNITVNGAGLIRNYRSQFNRISKD
jgi:phospholipid transport system substrate-binding protein